MTSWFRWSKTELANNPDWFSEVRFLYRAFMTDQKGARRIAQLTVELLENASEEPQRLSEITESVSVEASRKTVYRVLDALQKQGKIEKVNADGESDENGKSWALIEGDS